MASAFDTVTGAWLVVFDKDLQGVSSSPSNYGLVAALFNWTPQAPILIDGNVLSGGSVKVSPAGPAASISYDASVPDLVGVNGLPVEPFIVLPSIGFPIPVSAQYSIGASQIDIVMSEDVFINLATKSDFAAVVVPNVLTIQSVAIVTGNIIRLGINVDGPGTGADRVEYNGTPDGIEDATGNDVPLFVIGLDVVA